MWKPVLSKILKHSWLGAPVALLVHAAGAETLCQKLSLHCNFVPRTVKVEVPGRIVPGVSFRMFGNQGLDQVARMMWWAGWDGYEKPMPDLFAASSRTARCVFDVGAYTGFFSLISATCSPAARIFAFEPFPPPRGWLEKNVALNHLEARLHVVPVAMSDQAGEADFYVPTSKTGLMETSSSLNASFHQEHLESIKVPVVTLDEFVSSQNCGPIDLMKIDVETFEPSVLRGGRQTLLRDRPFIYLEVLPMANARDLQVIRDELGYQSGLLLPGGIEWQDQIQATDEFWDHIFCPVEKRKEFDALAGSLGYFAIHRN